MRAHRPNLALLQVGTSWALLLHVRTPPAAVSRERLLSGTLPWLPTRDAVRAYLSNKGN